MVMNTASQVQNDVPCTAPLLRVALAAAPERRRRLGRAHGSNAWCDVSIYAGRLMFAAGSDAICWKIVNRALL